jgi:hypothetical protein
MVQMAKRRKSISPIFENAIDSLRIGMEFFQRESNYSNHKHAILTVYHAIELTREPNRVTIEEWDGSSCVAAKSTLYGIEFTNAPQTF